MPVADRVKKADVRSPVRGTIKRLLAASLIDEVDDDQAIGRSMADAPDIDGLVYLSQPEGLSLGDIVTASVKEAAPDSRSGFSKRRRG